MVYNYNKHLKETNRYYKLKELKKNIYNSTNILSKEILKYPYNAIKLTNEAKKTNNKHFKNFKKSNIYKVWTTYLRTIISSYNKYNNNLINDDEYMRRLKLACTQIKTFFLKKM